MRLKFPEPEIPDDGFTGIDIFDREKTASFILNLAENVEDNLTLALDAPWGSGKSFFLKQFQKKAETEGFPCIVFDAFKNDISESAFAAITGEVISALERTEGVADDVKGSFKKAAVGAGKLAFKGAMKASVSYLSAGLLSKDSIEKLIGEADSGDVAESISQGLRAMLSSASDSAISSMVDAHAESQETIEKLQQSVESASRAMVLNLATEASRNDLGRTFFIIDELDRCRPDFAIDVLEVVKHFYDVESIVFIYSADFEKIRGMLEQRYGKGVDTQRYIEKYIDFWMQFPKKDPNRGSNVKNKYLEYLVTELPQGEYSRALVDLLEDYVEECPISLREIQKVCLYFQLICYNTTERHLRIPLAVVTLSFFRVLAPRVYFKLAEGEIDYDQLSKEFEKLGILIGKEKFEWLNSFLKYCLLPDLDGQPAPVTDWGGRFFRYHIDSRNIISLIAKGCMSDLKLPA